MSAARSSRSRAASATRLASAAPLFAALGDVTRLEIVARLCTHGPQSITRLSAGSPITRQAITKHLHALAQAGVIRSQRDGRERIWQVHAKRLHDVSSYLTQISLHWDEALQRLRAAVETKA